MLFLVSTGFVYNFSEMESTFPVPFWDGRLLMAPLHGFHLFDKEM